MYIYKIDKDNGRCVFMGTGFLETVSLYLDDEKHIHILGDADINVKDGYFANIKNITKSLDVFNVFFISGTAYDLLSENTKNRNDMLYFVERVGDKYE